MMEITEQEHSALIRLSTRDRILCCRFGPRWVALDDSPDSEWARKWVQENRIKAAMEAAHE